MKFNKILVLENESKRYAKPNRVDDCLNRSFKDIKVEKWFWFYHSFTKKKDKGLDRLMSLSPDTLILSYTNFSPSPLGGYGDRFGMYVSLLKTLKDLGKSLNICVITSPPLRWRTIDWVLNVNVVTEQKKRAKLMKTVIGYHNLYSIDYSQALVDDFYKASILIKKDWFINHLFVHETEFTNNFGKISKVSGFQPPDSERETASYFILEPKGKGYSSNTISIDTLIKLKDK